MFDAKRYTRSLWWRSILAWVLLTSAILAGLSYWLSSPYESRWGLFFMGWVILIGFFQPASPTGIEPEISSTLRSIRLVTRSSCSTELFVVIQVLVT